MTFLELRQEVRDRGFTYDSDARIGRWVNQAYGEICSAENWPFLYSDAIGAAPLQISDLGTVLSVSDSDQGTNLRYEDRRTLLDAYGDLTLTGTASVYYIDAQNTVATYPVGGTLTVRYLASPELSDDTDEPLIPERYQNLIVDGAVRRAYNDSDDFQAAQAIEAERQSGLDLMRGDLLEQQHDHPELVVDYGGSEDW